MAEDQEITFHTLEDRPLVTFALFAYNQEKYIREAVESAFSQTYEPLEIIISDDHSTDKTFEIIKEISTQYKGNHKIVIRQNSSNSGLNNHINQVASIASGNLIVMAAGDDISEPDRTSTLVVAWINNGKKDVAIQSGWITIDHNSKYIEKYSSRLNGASKDIESYFSKDRTLIHGATGAYSINLFKKYSNLPEKSSSEDKILSFRALLEDGIIGVTSLLVRYRIHENSLTTHILPFSSYKKWISRLDTEISTYNTHLNDLEIAHKECFIKNIDVFNKSLQKSLKRHKRNKTVFLIPRVGPLIYCLTNSSLGSISNRIAYFLKASDLENSIIFKAASYTKKTINKYIN